MNYNFFNKLLLIVFISIPLFLSGCAAVFTSDNISFPVKTDPEGAQVYAFREHGSKNIKKIKMSCVSPCSFELRQDHNYIVDINKHDYKPYSRIIHSYSSVEGISGSLASNVISEGLFAPIGMGIDAVSGADDRLFPGHITLQLIKSTDPENYKAHKTETKPVKDGNKSNTEGSPQNSDNKTR